jgi:predicted HTH domain antitoxin
MIRWSGRNEQGDASDHRRKNGLGEEFKVKTISIEIPDSLTPLEWGSDEAFASELRLAAAIQWYSQGVISQGRAAEIAGLDRTSFLLALGRAKVDAFQITDEALKEEVERGLEAYRQRLAADLPYSAGSSGPPE